MGVTAPDIAQIPMSAELAATLARGAEFAGATGATEVSLEHLLAALCDDPDAAAVLDASHISGERIKGDVISRVLESAQQGAAPQDSLGVSAEVRRILEAAAAAARGSRRRDINGAIVLAAIVGDARSAAAEILEAHGLTFENAIRALQAALQPPREAPQPPPPVADDVLARARERVQSRSAPSLRDIMKDIPRPASAESPNPMAEPSTAAPQEQAPEPPFPEPPLPHGLAPQPTFPQSPSDGQPSEPVASEHVQEPLGPPAPEPPVHDVRSADTRRRNEPPKPEPQLSPPPTEPMHGAPGRYPGPESRRPSGSEPEPQRRAEPSFGAPPPGNPSQNTRPASAPAQPGPQAPYPREPSLSLPSRPAQQPGSAGGPSHDPHGFPLPFPAAPNTPQQPGGGPGTAPPPPREMFDLPPRPQPSRVQPPPIPHGPGLGGPAHPQPRPSGPAPAPPPAQNRAPQFGPPGPGLSPTGPTAAPPMGAPGSLPAPAPIPRPNLGQETVFRPGAPIGAQPAPQSPAPPQAQRRAPKRGKAANVEAGQLAENIPRSMRVGKTVRAEIRIAKASVKSLTEGMEGGGQVWQHTAAITKAMSVRVRAPDGGFFIESASPETQWIESNLGYASDGFASWRFLITPQYRGWSDLQIIVSARTIGADGVAAETALPDQIIEVKVRANLGRAIVRIFSWTVAAVIGGALATFGESGMTIATALMKKLGH